MYKKLENISSITDILNASKKEKFNVNITNTSSNFDLFLVLKLFNDNKDSIIINAANLYKAQKLYEKVLGYTKKVVFFPFDDFISDELLASNDELKFERLNTIQKILNKEKTIIVTHTTALSRMQRNKNRWNESVLKFNTGKEINFKDLSEKLLAIGYKRVFTVEHKGEFSIRGSIVDISTIDSTFPHRIDFFDDEIDSIRQFDPETQKSIKKKKSFKVFPMNEFFVNKEEKEILENKLEGINDNLLIDLKENNNVTKLHKLISLIDTKNNILDLIENKIVFYENYDEHLTVYNNLILDLENFYMQNEYLKYLKIDLVLEESELISKSNNLITTFQTKKYENIKFTDIISIGARDVIDYRNVEHMLENIKGTVVFSVRTKKEKTQLMELLDVKNKDFVLVGKSDDLVVGKFNIVDSDYLPSFELIKEELTIINTDDIFSKGKNKKKVRYKSVLKQEQRLNNVDEIKPGDYIVHYSYGIGRYQGIKSMDLKGVKGDYISVVYKGGDSLYIPVEKIKLLSKYSSSEAAKPKMNKLGGTEWEKTKNKVKKRIKSLAFDLIEIHAKRDSMKGFKYSKYAKQMREFENDFPYDTTIDQQKAIDDVAEDMHSDRPMDRLICGDVGYGKTEVALRAAYKAVLNGKQISYLAPTTVLSRQHYKTFQDRLEKYGVNVQLVNRFQTAKKIREILKGLKEGYVDIVIGTHRLLSKDIEYKDLGLLIVDEEQRFGVNHKEIIKTLKANVDVLTLTATPIPRTLQMSIMGIKDISVLNTAPKNRYPVQTYVLGENKQVIKSSIERELSRDGQVFILYNKTSDIDIYASRIQSLVKDSKVRYAHGKMTKSELEDSITSFTNKEYNVLICTTIIETGIDIPNANTIIITDADKLGLSQLYQIRGRVGRSDKIAYAYMMYKEHKTIKEEAAKRLKAIKDFTELGSGFKIAMQDLSIRGAGDVLGAEQSGFIDGVGMKLYMKMLEDEIKEQKGQVVEEIEDTKKEGFNTSTHIDDEYISDESVKIEIHRKIDELTSYEKILELKAELIDRFGKLSFNIDEYLESKLFENYAKTYGITRIKKVRNLVSFRLSKKFSKELDGQKLFEYCSKISNDIKLSYKQEMLNVELNISNFKDSYVNVCNKIIQSMI